MAKSVPETVPVVDTLAEDLLEGNFRFWVQAVTASHLGTEDPVPDTPLTAICQRVPTAHTFGDMRFPTGEDSLRMFAHQTVLFDTKAILSANRRKNEGIGAGSSLGYRAKTAGLDDFVFAYLGIHEPRYARGIYPAFGVFVANSHPIERFPRCNASSRNLDSDELGEDFENIEKCFLLPDHARALMAHEILARHAGDFWHYWGTSQHCRDAAYRRQHWNWKIEFHYRGEVSVNDFAAILWPIQARSLSFDFGSTPDESYRRDAAKFRQMCSECSVIEYEWDPTSPSVSFLRASELATKFLLEHDRFPRSVSRNGEVD